MNLKQTIDYYLPTKEAFYEELVRQKYFLPAQKCNIMTVSFMDRVFRGEIYMPRIDDVRPVKIAKPPSKKDFKAELLEVMESLNPQPPGVELIAELKIKDADMRWMQGLLHSLVPDHYFFDPGYSSHRRAQRQNPVLVPDDKFAVYKDAFNGRLPPKPGKKAYVASQLFKPPTLTKAQRMQNELNRLAQVMRQNDVEIPDDIQFAQLQRDQIMQDEGEAVREQNHPQSQQQVLPNLPHQLYEPPHDQFEEQKDEWHEPNQSASNQPNYIMNAADLELEDFEQSVPAKELDFLKDDDTGNKTSVKKIQPIIKVESPFKGQVSAEKRSLAAAMEAMAVKSGEKSGTSHAYAQSRIDRRMMARKKK